MIVPTYSYLEYCYFSHFGQTVLDVCLFLLVLEVLGVLVILILLRASSSVQPYGPHIFPLVELSSSSSFKDSSFWRTYPHPMGHYHHQVGHHLHFHEGPAPPSRALQLGGPTLGGPLFHPFL